MRCAVAVILGSLIVSPAAAQQGGVELRISSTRLEVGESIPVQLVCTNTGEPSTPQAVVPDGLELRLTNAAPSRSQMMSIVNGRRSTRTTYTFRMQLVALKAGTYLLEPITVEADETSYQTRPVTIVVSNTRNTATPKGDRIVYVEMTAKPTSLYVTETVIATLVIGFRKVEIGGRMYDVDMLRSVLDQSRSQLSIFSGGKVSRSERVLKDSDGRRHRYEVFRVTTELRAEEVGEMRVGPVFLRANYPTAMRRGFFGRNEVSRSRKETVRVDAIVIDVKGPPLDGRPDGFTGAIGHFTLNIRAKPLRVDQGQPVTMTIAVRGTPLAGVAGPDLSTNAALVSRFDFAKDELVGDIEGPEKVYRRALFPKQAGPQTIPPIRWSYFDPTTERYITLLSDPIEIEVNPAATQTTTVPLVDESAVRQRPTSLTTLSGGISPNYVDPDQVLASLTATLSGPWIGAALGLPPILCLIVTLMTRHRSRLNADVGFARRRRAASEARSRIKQALAAAQTSERLGGISAALTGYLSDRFNLPQVALTPSEARDILAARGFEPDFSDGVAAFIASCDACRYAPGAISALSPDRAAADVRQWIRRIERSAQ